MIETTRLVSRHERALTIDVETSLSDLVDALSRGIAETANERSPIHDDPAIRLIVARMAELVGIATDDEQRARCRAACMSKITAGSKLPLLKQIVSQPITYDEPRKAAFHREVRRLLQQLATAMGFQKSEYEIRSNKAGPAVSGEITLHTETCYIQISSGGYGPGEIFFRRCDGRKDYTGGRNCWANLDELLDSREFASRIRSQLQLGPGKNTPSNDHVLFAA